MATVPSPRVAGSEAHRGPAGCRSSGRRGPVPRRGASPGPGPCEGGSVPTPAPCEEAAGGRQNREVSWDKVPGVASLLSLGHALRLPSPDRVVGGLPCLPETPPDKPTAGLARECTAPGGPHGRGAARVGSAGAAAELTHCAVSPAEGEVSAEEEGFENLNTMASTFIVLFLLGLFYSTTVTLFKVK
ncbi:hypothetical protein J1605_011783 [Eschrichtius robustus]|uniref:Uncharacterized protein n=1 Tax=Eschrichtius robustus TaxID=9764 RepID=A0AB34GP06_ESCRO|nr:hypothetical protein J1605_011783 [Eschrichtius robustus]